MQEKNKRNQRVTRSKKNAKGKQWYKDQIDELDIRHNSSVGYGGISDYKRMKVNYDLYNNILNLQDFSYVCQPFGAEAGELPATMVNRDIFSGKIKAMLGMERKRPFVFEAVATNPEATTSREQEEFKRIKEYVYKQAMAPIIEKIEKEAAQAAAGGEELNPEQQQALQQEIEQKTKAMTPSEVKQFMKRDYQDPVEVMSNQYLRYLIKELDLPRKFNKIFKHGMLSAKEVMYVGIINGEPDAWVVNSIRFNCDKSPDLEFIEDGEWATQEYRMTPSEIIGIFGSELTDKQIDDIYDKYSYRGTTTEDSVFTFESGNYNNSDTSGSTVRVFHAVWKSLRRVGFLEYMDDNGQKQIDFVDESYKLNEEAGDIVIDWEWIPETYEGWRIEDDIYIQMQPVPGQTKDLENIHKCKLPYVGAIHDCLNSEETALADRIKTYQYYYNIVMYRLEIMLASDKGKKIMMNINAVPDDADMDIEKIQYFMESTPFLWFNPDDEGKGIQDVNSVAKGIDLSLASDISKYVELAEYLKNQCGVSVGITQEMEGQFQNRATNQNVQQSLFQSSNILEPYFEIHDHVKMNVLTQLLETAKIAYADHPPKKLMYILDDMSRELIDFDPGLLDNSTLGIFIANASKIKETKNTLEQMTHAAMQNQTVEMSDVIRVLRTDGLREAEEILKVAEDEREERAAAQQQQQAEIEKEAAAKAEEYAQKQHERQIELIEKQAKEDRETKLAVTNLTAASFNPDQDKDNDGVNDYVELARNGLDADIKERESSRKDRAQAHNENVDNQKLQLEKEKVNVQKQQKKSERKK